MIGGGGGVSHSQIATSKSNSSGPPSLSPQPHHDQPWCGWCENIVCGYLYVSDLAFVILKGIYGFKFPKRFLEISSRDLTSFLLRLI
jgi:hypothetical protein